MRLLCKLFNHKWEHLYTVDIDNDCNAGPEYLYAIVCDRCGEVEDFV
jgi:hypothetical protein